MEKIEQIFHGEMLLAIIIRQDFVSSGIKFFTPDSFSQQLAYMSHSKGKIIQRHYHNPVKREVHFTQEVLIIKRGKLKVDFYDRELNYTESRVLQQGDIILLSDGGHGFEILEDLEMFEVKQGPFAGDVDKTRF